MSHTVHIEGIKELRRQVEALSRSLPPDKVEPVSLRGAQVVADEARRLAPEGPTGNLRKSIIAKTLRRRGNEAAPAIAAVDRKYGVGIEGKGGGAGSHAHLVELGTGERIGRKVTAGKRDYRGRRFGSMPKRPFLRPAFDKKNRQVLEQMIRELGELVDKAVAQQ